MDIQDLIVQGKTGFCQCSGAFLATVLVVTSAIYTLIMIKAAGLGVNRCFSGTHYYITNYHPKDIINFKQFYLKIKFT